MSKVPFPLLAACLLAGVVPAAPTHGQNPAKDNDKRAVWISRDLPVGEAQDTRSDPERLFIPQGRMPAERVNQIAVNPSKLVDAKDPTKGTCVEYAFKFTRADDWQGVYSLVGGDSWGARPGINVKELLMPMGKEAVVLRFRARGEKGGEVATFQVGAVTTGPHKSSLLFPRTAPQDPTRLPNRWADFEIPLVASELTNVIDPFCVVARAGDNPGRALVQVYVDDVRFEVVPPQPRKK
ncbi:MAG TPA: hypothetical protein VD866_25645 [Urbifossiella sp.]|nr:hypothetical protein [Urbifossiella sp.]